MSDTPAPPDLPRPTQLWKQFTPERKLQAAEAFWQDENASVEQAEAVATIANRIKFRLKSVISMPLDKKARNLATMPGISELVAARLLVAFHLTHQRPMMGAFLDALGIAHEEGLIADEELKAPDEATLKKAVKAISASYPAPDVALYLTTLSWQDPETWGGLAKLPEVRPPAPVS